MSGSESCCIDRPVTSPLAALYRPLLLHLGDIYCRLFHHSISLPVNGRYRCWDCHREFETDW